MDSNLLIYIFWGYDAYYLLDVEQIIFPLPENKTISIGILNDNNKSQKFFSQKFNNKYHAI